MDMQTSVMASEFPVVTIFFCNRDKLNVSVEPPLVGTLYSTATPP